MTPASPKNPTRHDTLNAVTGRSGKGTARQTIRIDATLWDEFGELATSVGTDRSAVVRDLIREWVEQQRQAADRQAGDQ